MERQIDPKAIGVMERRGLGPWTIRVPADLQKSGEIWLWTATRDRVLDDEMRLAIIAFATGLKAD